jgi:hypothetical protein
MPCAASKQQALNYSAVRPSIFSVKGHVTRATNHFHELVRRTK